MWLSPWDGTKQIRFCDLDPFYIEICRRIRLVAETTNVVTARGTTSAVERVNADGLSGKTGDAWLPIEAEKALTLPAGGFNYKLMADVVWGNKYKRTIAITPREEDGSSGIEVIAQGLTRGNGKTKGYHERRIPLTRKAVSLLRRGQFDLPAKLATERIQNIAAMRSSVLRTALFALFEAGTERPDFDRRTTKLQVEPFVQAFEHGEDARFFDDLNIELDADTEAEQHAERLTWLIGLAERAEAALRNAFDAGPQCGERRYRARARALAYFHGALRNGKHFPQLAQHLRAHPSPKVTTP